MLSVEEARAVVLQNTPVLASEEVGVAEADGRVLAEDVVAAHDVAPFAGSAMDGFAVRTPIGGPLRIAGESRAGAPAPEVVRAGEAIRISTGAALPSGADAVVPVERTSEHDGVIAVEGAVEAGDHVRRPGEDLRAGSVVLERGSTLDPAALGVAVGAGRDRLLCGRRPRVAIVSTGDELVAPGAPLGPGQIHNSNAVALAALARRCGATVGHVAHAPDDPRATEAALAAALVAADVLLITGGVSVGPHDHVKPALARLGVGQAFWRVALKPGKPTWFGTREATLVFGLPGNPVSALVTFLLFARPALCALQGGSPPPRRRAPLGHAQARNPQRDEAVRVRLDEHGRAHATGPQGSHVLSSMLGAGALALVPAGEGELAAGREVELEVL